ncbi:MAG TPA: hypothetical protein VH079_17775 [Terriglobales bacterium]|nr:hypothetical protein [Terriglobales bacterium]
MNFQKTLGQIIREEPSGTWLAISIDQKIVAGAGSTPGEAKQAATTRGIREIILLRVPERAVTSSYKQAV